MAKRTITIALNNNKCKLTGHQSALIDVREELKVKHPSAFFIRPHMPRGWDGNMRFITEYGYMFIGYFPWLAYACKKLDIELEVDDNRLLPEIDYKIPRRVGRNKPRPYQIAAVKSILDNKVAGVKFPIGGINAATNAGKTTMMAMFYLATGQRTIMLLNDSDLFKQFEKEIPELLPDAHIGFVQGKKRLNELQADFVVAQVKTLSLYVKEIANELADFKVCLVDEYDLADNKTYKTVLERLYNSSIRVGLSGTAFMGKLAKHKFKHASLKQFFSEEVFKITKQELIKKGHSARLSIRIVTGNTLPFKGTYSGWQDVYDKYITHNEQRQQEILDLVRFNVKVRKRLPILIICRFKPHVLNVYNMLAEAFPELNIDWVHSEKKGRDKVLTRFRDNELDILVGSYILNRGKNFPFIQVIIQASGSDSPEIISQIMGRGERTHSSKRRTYIYDFFDIGKYLDRHSKHRVNYYLQEGFRVLKLYKKSTGKK